MGHAHVLKDQVVDAQWFTRIDIKGLQVGIHPIHTSLACSQAEIRRGLTEPARRIGSRHGNGHGFADLFTSEHQIVHDQLGRKIQILGHA